MSYVVWLSYDSTCYGGWQKQRNMDRTIRGKLEEILRRLDETPVEMRGSGRMGADVHTPAQVANSRLNRETAPRDVMEYLNRYLPEDVGVWKIEKTPERFHSRLNAVRKIYRYQIKVEPEKDVFQRRYYYGLGLELDMKAMEQTADLLTGAQDFKSFRGNKKTRKSTVHTSESVQFGRIGDTKLHVSFTGNGFLQQMVRALTGILIEAGFGKWQSDDMNRTLEARDRQEVGPTTPSQGLFPEKVEYGKLR